MSKGEETKERILQQAGELFNQLGYAGTSMSDIMRVTGLKKGGIYNHFQSKEELALQAFDYAINNVIQRYRVALLSKRHAVERLQAIVDAFASYADNPPLKGGCPLLNTAVESDRVHPALRERAREAMNSWYDMIRRVVQKGIKRGEIRSTVEPDEVATIAIAILEGGIMIAQLQDNPIYLKRAISHLNKYIESLRQV